MNLTVITASYNSEASIENTLNSMLSQSIADFEYLVIDGNSKDKTVEIIKSFEPKFKEKGVHYKWISEPDQGIYDAWNKGLKMATGNWISFLGSDDYYLDFALENYNQELNKIENKGLDIIYSEVKVVNRSKTLKVIQGTWSWPIFKRYMNIAHVGAFHNVNYFKKHGLFDISYKITGDYELLLRAGSELKTLKLNAITAIMEADGVSNSNISKVLKETFRAKHETVSINIVICISDYVWATMKYSLKKNLP